MKFKSGVELKKLTPALSWIIQCLSELEQDVTITSINDGLHSQFPLSRHYTDEAVDIRSHDIVDKQKLLTDLRNKLNINEMKNNAFTVILESEGQPNEHIHIQVRKGGTFP